MKQTLPIFAAAALLPACATVKGAASDAKTVGKTAVQMVQDIPDIPLPSLPRADHTPFTENAADVQAYCKAINVRWKHGKEQVKLGEELLAQGQARVEKGKRILREGERRIATGELSVEEAQRDMAVRTGRAKPEPRDYAEITDPEFLKSIRIQLQNAIKRMEYGSEQVAFGASEIEKGQARAEEGIQRLKQGHAYMAEDDGRCRQIRAGGMLEEDPA